MIDTEIRKPKTAHVRWMVRRDMPEVLNIEGAGFESPWSEEEFLRALRQRNCIGMVAEQDDRVVGYMVYELHRDRLRVLRIAVDPDRRREDVGRCMADKLKAKLSPDRRRFIELLVRETNMGGLLFLKEMGFRATGVDRGAFDDSGEDGYAMVYEL